MHATLQKTTVVRFCFAIAVLCIAVYARSLGNDFVYWDDPILILENPIIRGFSPTLIAKAFTNYDPELYTPLTFLSLQLNYVIAGLHPFLYHLTNLVFHIGSAILTGWVTFLLFRKSRVAALTALLFAIHPINVETVAWAAARKDVLSSFFCLLSLACVLHWRAGDNRRWYWAGVIVFLCGLLSKVSILSLPVVLLLIDWRDKKLSWKSFRHTALFFALSAVFGIVAIFGKAESSRHVLEKALIAGRATMWTLIHHVLPIGYSVLYPYDVPISLGSLDLLFACVAVIGVCVAAWWLRFRARTVTFGWFWFLLFLAPSFLNMEKGGDTIRDVYVTSDRYAYLACIGLFFIVAHALDRIKRKQAFLAISGIMITVLAVLAHLQSLTWRNTETLFRHVLRSYPQSHVAWNNIGAFYDEHGLYDEAKAAYVQSVQLKETGHGWFNLGQIAMRENRPDDAIEAFTRAIALRSYHPVAQQNLGALLLNKGLPAEALPHLLEAQRLAPRTLETYLNLGIALERLQNPVDARRAYERALQIDPDNAYAKERIQAL